MFREQIKSIKYIQNMAEETEASHSEIERGIEDLKKKLMSLDGYDEVINSEEYKTALEREKNKPVIRTPLEYKSFEEISREAGRNIKHNVGLKDILTPDDFRELDSRIDSHIKEFNREYSLDSWDYAIAGTCGLVAGMLDWACVKAPLKPATKFDAPADGIFNRLVQRGFNKVLPPDFSHKLSESFTIGSADTSVKNRLSSFSGNLSPYSHRLKEFSHDPVLGFIFGAFDIMNDSCTMIDGGKIVTYKSVQPNYFDGNIFNAMGRMFGHLASDINAPSAAGNRGMGLPAPFMGLLSMLKDVNVNGESVGKNVEYMYLKGYDMRQFAVTSIPVALMEILLRACWVIKGVAMDGKTFLAALSETAPFNMHKKFRMITAISYGVLCAANAGKVYVTDNILNLNYAAWLGLVWHGFFALKWALLDKHFELWNSFERKELARLEETINGIDRLAQEAEALPV